MVQSMLIDRCKLKFHRTMKELPIYELVLAKGGPKMQEAKADEQFSTMNNDTQLTVKATTMPQLAEQLSAQLNRSVLDKTGLAGKYDFTLHYAPDHDEPAPGYGPGAAQPDSGPGAAQPDSGPGAAQPDSGPGAAQPDSGPGAAQPDSGPGAAQPDSGPGAAQPDSGPGAAQPDSGPGAAQPDSGPGAAQPDSGPSIFSAIQDQLGLKLVAGKGPVEMIVIDHIEPPSPN